MQQGEKHLKLKLRKLDFCNQGEVLITPRKSNDCYEGMLFFHNDPLPDWIDAVYRLQVNEYNGKATLQLLLEHWFQADGQVIGDVS